MLGVSLSFYKKPLKFVPVHLNRKPVKSLNLDEVINLNSEYLYGQKDIFDSIHRVPLRDYKKIDLEAISKIRLSTIFMMDSSVEDLFEKNLHFVLVKKIISSMWRWGHRRSNWNDVVSAYNGIRSFDFGKKDFSVRLDHSTWYNEKGYSEHTRIYLDGVFGYLIYYKNTHVMTIGFSILPGRKLLLQQVQLANRHGNRWLFKLPHNYLEYVIGRMFAAFPKYSIYLVDGQTIVQKYIRDYAASIERYNNKPYATNSEEAVELEERLIHTKKDAQRIASFYNNLKRYAKTDRVVTFSKVFYHKIEDRIHGT
jgi:hypothetical protein